MPFPIDHLFTVTTNRVPAQAALERMGFALTARGEHPGRGTSNHLMFFGRCYWELLSVDQVTNGNAELLGKVSPLVGCALRTNDLTADAATAARLGARVGSTEWVTRPVQVDGAWQIARFAVAAVQTPTPVDAYLFFCQHLTPEWVWPREGPQHPNGAIRLRSVHVVGAEPGAQQGLFPLLGSGGGDSPKISYLAVDDYAAEFDGASTLRLDDGKTRLAGISVAVRNLNRCEAYLSDRQVPYRRVNDGVAVLSEVVGHPVVFTD
jgi:hypothetical protein